MEVEELEKDNYVVVLRLEGAVDKISASVVIVSCSNKTVAAETKVVSFLITEIGLSGDRLAYFPCLKFICSDMLV